MMWWPFGTSAAPAEAAAAPPAPPPTREEARARVVDLLQQPPEARTEATPFPPGAKYILAAVGIAATTAFAGTTLWQLRRIRTRQGPSILESLAAESGGQEGSAGLSALRKARVPPPALASASAPASAPAQKSPPAFPLRRSQEKDQPAAPQPDDERVARATFLSGLRSSFGNGEEEGPTEATEASPDAVKLAFQAFAYSLVVVGASTALAWQILRRSLGLNDLHEFIEYLQDHGPFAMQPKPSAEITEMEARPSILGDWMAARIDQIGNFVGKPLAKWGKSVPVPSLPEDAHVPEHEQEAQDAFDWFNQLAEAMEEEVQAEYRQRMARRAARQLST